MSSSRQVNIALLQLFSNGDCLFATVVARQIKNDYPGCTLTWYISDRCVGIIDNNPDIDAKVIIEIKNKDAEKAWFLTDRLLREKCSSGEIDYYFSTQIIGDNVANYNGTIRGTIFKNYPYSITVGYRPFIFLTASEVERVRTFITKNNVLAFKRIVLFECAPVSGQVPLNPQIAQEIALHCLEGLKDCCFILTSGQRLDSKDSRIIDASELSIRENAELINYSTHFVGCSSGISWLNTTTWCKQIPILQMLNEHSFYFNSMVRDHLFLNIDHSNIIEVRYSAAKKISSVISDFVQNPIAARQKYHTDFQDKSSTIYTLGRRLIAQKKINLAFQLIQNTFTLNKRNLWYYYLIIKLLLLSPVFLIFKSEKS
jgi:hypothetical protein